jgi:LEA14-like dessication related protein
MIVYAAIAGLLALMGGFAYYASSENTELEKVEIELFEIEVGSINKVENTAELKVKFLVTNPGDKTFTVSLINYELFADGEYVGTGQYSTADIPMPGRAIFSSGSTIPLESSLELQKSEISNDLYESILENEIIGYKAEGKITTESAWSIVEKEFESNT